MRFNARLMATLCALLIGCGQSTSGPAVLVEDATASSDIEDAQPSTDTTQDPQGPETSDDLTETSPGNADRAGMEDGFLLACDDAALSVFSVPTEQELQGAARGDVFSCTRDAIWPEAALASDAAQLGLAIASDLLQVRLSYRTERAPGVPGIGTASVLLPWPLPTTPLDVVVVAHGTAGLADHCAGSWYPGFFDNMSLAFASQGYAVIAPDYAGLGNPGVQGYGDALDTTHSLLDAPGALKELIQGDLLTSRVVVVGHSQGGGAALNVQGRAKSYGMDGDLVAVVNFAGRVLTDTTLDANLFKWAHLVPINYALGSSAAFSSLMLYAYGYNALDPPNPGVFFHPDHREEVMGWIESQCIYELIGSFATMDSSLMFDDVIDPSFYAGMVSCIEGAASCDAVHQGYAQRLINNVIPADPTGAEILIHATLADTIVPADKLACTVDALDAWGKPATTCVSASSTHSTVVDNNLSHAVAWVNAALTNGPLPDCPEPLTALPTCDP